MLFSVHRITRLVDDQLPKLLATLLDIEQVLSKNVDGVNIADKAITTALLADGAVSQPKVADPIGLGASGTFIGDGTANRVINVGFTPRYVWVARVDTSDIFEAVGDGATRLTQFWRSSAGVISSGDADWQGIATNGLKCGSAVTGGLSNTSGKTYYYFAAR